MMFRMQKQICDNTTVEKIRANKEAEEKIEVMKVDKEGEKC